MLGMASIIALLITLWALTFYRLRLRFSSFILITELTLFWVVGVYGDTTAIVIASLVLPLIILINIPWLRAQLISRFIMRYVKKSLPQLSETEQEAIASGSTWWERELFCGRPDWNKLHTFGQPVLLPDGRDFLNNQVTTLCAMLNDWKITHDQHDLPEEVWNYLKAEKFFGMTIPKRYGGLGFSAFAHSCVISMIASRSYSAAVTVMVPNSLGPAELLQHYGTPLQKDYYLPRLASGDEIPCFALTSPTAGSDATSIIDSGIVCKGIYEDKECLGLRLNWNKRYITLAPVATLLGVAVHVFDPERMLSDTEDVGISLVLVPTHCAGVVQGQRHSPLHQAFMNGPISGTDVFVPLEQVVGGEKMLGKGWQMITDSLAVGRGISLPAVSSAAAKICYRMTGAYARVREQFGTYIGQFDGIGKVLARIGANTYLCEATRIFTTGAIDSGAKPAIASAITKYHLTELSRQAINDAMDVHAGRGIMLGENNYLANLYTAMPIGITVEGANILTRNLIIFGQGAIRCHLYLAKELEALNFADPRKGLLRFDKLVFKHIGYFFSNFSRALSYGITGGKTIKVPENLLLKNYYRQLTRMSTAFALVVDVAFISLGGKLKNRENLSARLGDVLSQLYLASSVLKYFRDNDQPKEDLPFAQYCLESCLYKAQMALVGFIENLPSRRCRSCLNKIVFPWSKPYREPSDALERQIASELMKPSEQRDRITEYCYLSHDDKEATRIMELAFIAAVDSEEARARVKAAIREGKIDRQLSADEQLKSALQSDIISTEELEQITLFNRLQYQAIQVDAQDIAIL
jgi:acyl-CoA dehydrogenase